VDHAAADGDGDVDPVARHGDTVRGLNTEARRREPNDSE
jgi:hypothetical protein